MRFVGKDVHCVTVTQEDTQDGVCSIIIVECLLIQEALMATIKKTFNRIIIENDSQSKLMLFLARFLYA